MLTNPTKTVTFLTNLIHFIMKINWKLILGRNDTNEAKEKNELASDSKTDQTRPQCDVCFKTFATKPSLRRHKITHTGKKRFECPECAKSFYRKENLTSHLKVHSNVKSHACLQCRKAFKHLKSLRSHMKRLHPEAEPSSYN